MPSNHPYHPHSPTPFGSVMLGRDFSGEKYRFGFGGYEGDNEVNGSGNFYSTKWRQFNPRLVIWLLKDPKTSKYPFNSPFVAFGNNPIFYLDPGGDTLRVSQPNQAMFIEDASLIFQTDASKLFSFNKKGDLNLTELGQNSIHRWQKYGSAKSKIYNGLQTIISSDEITEIHYVNPKDNIENPENGGVLINEDGEKINVDMNYYGGEFTLTKTDIAAFKIKNLKNNHIFISKNKYSNDKWGDKRENSLFHGFGHVIYQKNSEQEKVIEFDNIARLLNGDPLRDVDAKHKNQPDSTKFSK